MIKCFLSHSSSDKESYVRIVAEKIRKENRIIDEEAFEEGMVTAEEIIKYLDKSSLFVFFISNKSLDSEWVKLELDRARELLDENTIKRVYPIIIDPKIEYKDKRIPEWMRDQLNIQLISSPTHAARKINARLIELTWADHPRLKERRDIFVGRNDQIKLIEERLDDLQRQMPTVLIASGLPSIGRRSLMTHSLRKANLVTDSYDFSVVSLTSMDSIEDFIIKCCDLGVVEVNNIREILNADLHRKIEIAKNVALQIVNTKERIIIEDRGVIVQNNGDIADWFLEIIDHIRTKDYLAFLIVSQFRARPSLQRTNPAFFNIHIYELEKPERNGLLKRYSTFQEINLSREDSFFFSQLLTGYPEQVLFTVDLIKEEGLFSAKKSSHSIQQFGSDKAKIVLDAFNDNNNVLDFIYLLSRFEFVSYDVLFDIVDENTYLPILEKLFSHSICEKVGSTSDYIRVNEVIRDYVSRNRFGKVNPFEESIKNHVVKFNLSSLNNGQDVSDYIFSGQEGLMYGNEIPDDLLIPSIFIKAIKKLYDEKRNYIDALSLANRLLEKETSIHHSAIDQVRFIKCQCLARTRNGEFFEEVRKIKEPERTFLYGFYYRLGGKFEDASKCYNALLGKGNRDPRVLGELTLVYMQSDEYDLAYNLAYESYKNRPGNILNANNYFTCLILRDKNEENKKELKEIISNMELDGSPKAKEIRGSAHARFIAYYEDSEEQSFSLIESVINEFPDVNYPVLTKAELATHFMNRQKLREAINLIDSNKIRLSQTYRTIIRYRAMLMAMDGQLAPAKSLIEKELKGLIKSSYKRLVDRLDYLYENRNN
ncbi:MULTISPECIES: toll/interleukin-1 receptor domain-containing protein [Klebsiella pneumoniae complex]|uniref:toll/interleukin-1 receptor domain-containing protein n=1 Tax=Klebsiella pneumoniae complex TaxID=3390273 RepID=UPI0018DBAA11|nr:MULTISPECIES: toll/interleukin-1 receptor domain-containing protein [Klebsiella]HCM7776356.1 toll/interleukin-1 receptor domain-containing protein [Klebsiella quasipneumoniae subsp. similipneumoniae]HDU6145290.1 toll/interleukin-1 receptor domain-containing protein [Klebsiella pneumoniae subsp. pneumoniae]MBX8865273.1 toll/interleukin-1 receptor domain-containing protein [Klebsiella pneumoniae]MCQ0804148.1 toll/interleukin-1 receptor domain-containing protein [Klebsiella pneumoniae]QPW02134